MTLLKDQAASGVRWSTVSQIGKQGIQILTTVILARLLPATDFGLLGMAMVVIGFIDIFKDLGTTTAIIQKKDLPDMLLSSVFWVNVVFGITAMAVLLLFAPVGGVIYREPRVVAVLQVLSLNFFISGLSILQQALLERSLGFNALAKIEISATVCGAVIGVLLAFAGAGVWSLVFQSLMAVSVTSVSLWLSSSWRPRWIFDWDQIRSISSFSLNLVGYSIFNYFSRNADYFLIGRFLGAQDLGYYTLAYRILLFPIQSISQVIRRVMLPVYSSIQDDNRRFSNAYLKVAATIALVSFPLMMGILTLAKPFVMVFFGAKWEPVIPLIMILAPVGLTQSVGTMVGTIYQAKGRTDWMFRWGIMSGIAILFAFAIGLRWGIAGVALAYAIATFCLTYFNHAIPFRLIDLKFRRFMVALKMPFINSFLMLLVIQFFIYFLPSDFPNKLILGLSILLGVVVYLSISLLTNREQIQELWQLAQGKESRL